MNWHSPTKPMADLLTSVKSTNVKHFNSTVTYQPIYDMKKFLERVRLGGTSEYLTEKVYTNPCPVACF